MLKNIRNKAEQTWMPISKQNLKKNLKSCSEAIPKETIFVYLIKLGGEKLVIRNKSWTIQRLYESKIVLTYVEVKNMGKLPFRLRDEYISKLNKANVYIIYDITECSERGHIKYKFNSDDFLLNQCKSSEFLKNHLFFITDKQSPQNVRLSYNSIVPNYIYKAGGVLKYSKVWMIVAAYIEFQHALLFAGKDTVKDDKSRERLARALQTDGNEQYEYGKQFGKSNYILRFLWQKEAIKNNCTNAVDIDYQCLKDARFDSRTIERLCIELLDSGFYPIAKKLYDDEIKKESPDVWKIKEYTEKGIKTVKMEDYYNYTKERCFILGKYSDLVCHEEALKGFKRFFEIYNTTSDSNFEKYCMQSVIHYMYYAYAGELDVGEDILPDYKLALKYYKKTLDVCDSFDDTIFDIAKEFCKGGGVKRNVEHGIDLLKILVDKKIESAKDFIIQLAEELVKKREYSMAEKCYKICCEFNTEYCEKYILSKMLREINERCESNDK